MRVIVKRGSPEDGGRLREEVFEVPVPPGASVSTVLQSINRRVDGSVAYYLSCRRGLCACCVVRVDGRIEKACVTLATDGMVIEPIRTELLVKDTVVHLGVPREHVFPLDGASLTTTPTTARRPRRRGEGSCD